MTTAILLMVRNGLKMKYVSFTYLNKWTRKPVESKRPYKKLNIVFMFVLSCQFMTWEM